MKVRKTFIQQGPETRQQVSGPDFLPSVLRLLNRLSPLIPQITNNIPINYDETFNIDICYFI